jgi:phage-related protein
MFPTFTPPIPPSPGTRQERDIKLYVAEFGDGYEQVVPNGLNHMRRKLSLSWDSLTPTDSNTIDSFLKTQKGYLPFYYTPSDELTAIAWTCKEWSFQRNQSGFRSLTAQFIESFTPDV